MRYLRSLFLIILILTLSISCDIFKRDKEIADLEFFYVPSSGVGEWDGFLEMYLWFWTGYIRVNNEVQVRIVRYEFFWADLDGNILSGGQMSLRNITADYNYGVTDGIVMPGMTYCNQIFNYSADPSYGFRIIEIIYGIDENLNEVKARAEYIGYPGGEG